VLLAVALLGACSSQADKQKVADAVRDSVPAAAGQRVGGFMGMAVRTVKAPANGLVAGGQDGGAFPPMAFAAEPHSGRVALLATPGKPADFLASATTYYARRVGARPDERRPWVRVDLRRLHEEESPDIGTLTEQVGRGWATVVGPHLMLDLLAGVLAGSVKAGKAAADGSRSVKFNVSIDKANRELDLSEDARDERSYVLRSIAIKGDIFPGEATLRANGSLSRLLITFFMTPDRLTKLALAVDLRVERSARVNAIPLAPPERKTTIRVSAMPALISTMTQNVDAARFNATAPTTPTVPTTTPGAP
jgi:hypothetical protein